MTSQRTNYRLLFQIYAMFNSTVVTLIQNSIRNSSVGRWTYHISIHSKPNTTKNLIVWLKEKLHSDTQVMIGDHIGNHICDQLIGNKINILFPNTCSIFISGVTENAEINWEGACSEFDFPLHHTKIDFSKKLSTSSISMPEL